MFSSASTFRAHSRVAQVVEQVTVNHRVGGSSPSSGAPYTTEAQALASNGPGTSPGPLTFVYVRSVSVAAIGDIIRSQSVQIRPNKSFSTRSGKEEIA